MLCPLVSFGPVVRPMNAEYSAARLANMFAASFMDSADTLLNPLHVYFFIAVLFFLFAFKFANFADYPRSTPNTSELVACNL